MYRSKIEKMLAGKKSNTIAMASGLPVKPKRRIKVRKLRKNGLTMFLNTMGMKSVFTGTDGQKYKCKYGENSDGSCVNGVLVKV